MYVVVNGASTCLDGNRAQRKRQQRAMENEAKQATDTTGTIAPGGAATASDPAVTAEILELETAIGHGKHLGADVSPYEARLRAIRPAPATT